MKHILSTFCLMAAVAAPVAAQEAEQDSAQATVRDSAKMVKSMLSEVPMREIKGRVYDNATKQPTAGISVSAFNDARYAAMTDEKGDYVIQVPVYVTSFGCGVMAIMPFKFQSVGEKTRWMLIFSAILSIRSIRLRGLLRVKKQMAVDYNTNEVSIDGRFKTSWVLIYIPLRAVVCRGWVWPCS